MTSRLAATRVLPDLSSVKRDGSFCCGGSWLSLHSRLDLTGHGQKGLFDIGGCLGRSLEELNTKGVSKLLSLLGRNNTLSGQIGLVTHKQLVDVFCRISINFVKPLLDIVEGLLVRDIVHHNDSMGTTVIRRGNRTETFLSSGIPNLKLDGLSIQLNGADLKVDTNGRNVGFRVGIVGKSKEQTRFTNTRISNKKKLEQVVAARMKRKRKKAGLDYGFQQDIGSILLRQLERQGVIGDGTTTVKTMAHVAAASGHDKPDRGQGGHCKE